MVREWDQKRRCFSVSVDKSHGWETGQLAGAVPKQVPNLISTTQFVLFLSFQRLLHIATSYYFGIFNYCCADTCLGEALPSFLPTHSLVFLPGFSLLLLLLPPSPVFSIPTSSDLCTFTKIQETHKGIWVLSLKNLFKHVTHYTIPTQKAHYTGCPKTSTSWINHTFWTQAASSAQIIASQMIMRTQQSSLLLVPCSYMDFLPLISSFLHIFLPEVPPSHVIFIPHYPLSSGVPLMLSQKEARGRQKFCWICASCLSGAQEEPSWTSKRQDNGTGALLMQAASGRDDQIKELPKFSFFPKKRPGRTWRK